MKSSANKKRTLDKKIVSGKRVLVRADLDVPLKKTVSGSVVVADDTRIECALPSIRFLMENKARVIVVGHLGRPNKILKEFSLYPVAEALAEKLKLKIIVIGEGVDKLPSYSIPHLFFFTGDLKSEKVSGLLQKLNPADVAVLENIRFYPEEESNNEQFGKMLASMADLYVNDCFSVEHREHASVIRPPEHIPGYLGLELDRELKALDKVRVRPARPFTVLIGGVKLSSKVKGLDALAHKCDKILVGGGVATLFFAARGYEIGKSVFESKHVPLAKSLLRDHKPKIILPTDVIVARSREQPGTARVTSPSQVEPAEMILDIGPETMRLFSEQIRASKTLLWAGPLGLFEDRKFSHGTRAVGRIFASRCSSGKAFGVAGGGNTLEALGELGVLEDVNFVSTGGSAMVQYVAGEKLPGLQALGL